MAVERMKYWTSRLLNLNRSNSKAPHKPILILTLIKGFDDGDYSENKIRITPKLVADFQSIWASLVSPKLNYRKRFYYPFYHLSKEKPPFWFLKTFPGRKIIENKSNSINGINHLVENVAYGTLDEKLFAILTEPIPREAIREKITEVYFNKRSFYQQLRIDYNKAAEAEVEYQDGKTKLKKYEPQWDDKAEYKFVRHEKFKVGVLGAYNYRCALTGYKLIDKYERSIVQACHIDQHATSGNNAIVNGIAMTPSMHNAFDKFLFYFNDDYKIEMTPGWTEQLENPYGDKFLHSIRELNGRQIPFLPKEARYYPDKHAIQNHRERALQSLKRS